MKITDQNPLEIIKNFGKLNNGDFFQFDIYFYIKIDEYSAFNIIDCQLEEFSASHLVVQRIGEIILH